MNEKYNGWTNYATWRVNLEIFDSMSMDDFGLGNLKVWEEPDTYELSKAMKEQAEYRIECTSPEGLARDYAMAFLSDVDWYEIAKHMLNDYAEQD